MTNVKDRNQSLSPIQISHRKCADCKQHGADLVTSGHSPCNLATPEMQKQGKKGRGGGTVVDAEAAMCFTAKLPNFIQLILAE